jgi:hypothetical protein
VEPRWRRIFATMSETFWVLAIAVVALFAFFVALGAFAPDDVWGVTVVVCLLALAWLGHAMWVDRHSHGRDPRSVRARERRGF